MLKHVDVSDYSSIIFLLILPWTFCLIEPVSIEDRHIIHLYRISPDFFKGDFRSRSSKMTSPVVDFRTATSVYDFVVKDGEGNEVSLDKYRDQVLMIVNIASKCGLTKSNYKELTELKQKYEDKNFKLLSFPCNQFGSQMPEGDGEEMVCHLRSANADLGDVFGKVNVNGDDAIPLYKYLKLKQPGNLGSFIKWNFTKFIVDKNGQPVERFAPTTSPLDICKNIDKYL